MDNTTATARRTAMLSALNTGRRKAKNAAAAMAKAIAVFYAAFTALAAYFSISVTRGPGVDTAALILIAAVLGMNGLAKTDMALTTRGPNWWKSAPILKLFHFISNEGELAGIFVGAVALCALSITGRINDVRHWPVAEGFTLLGIMSAANLAVKHLRPLMYATERAFGIIGGIIGMPRLGIYAVIVVFSIFSSLTGEPAAAVFQSDYLGARVSNEDRHKVAVGLAASIGSGGPFLWFAAPPILIVSVMVQKRFGWSIADLIWFVGIGGGLHVLASSLTFGHLIRPLTKKRTTKWGMNALCGLGILCALVVLHIVYSHGVWWLWVLDISAAAASFQMARAKYKHASMEEHEAAFTAKWQPLILAVLLVSLEIIGVEGEMAVVYLGGMIPQGLPPVWIGIILFFVTALVSHFADNALASRVFMAIPITMIAAIGLKNAELLAATVMMGALFGSLLTIPANLPNFYLARAFKVTPGQWIGYSWKIYPTVIGYLIWIVLQFKVF